LVFLRLALIVDKLIVNPFVSVTEVFGVYNAMYPFASGDRILSLNEIIAGRFPEFFALFGFRRKAAKGLFDKVLREAETTVAGIIENFVGHVGNAGMTVGILESISFVPVVSEFPTIIKNISLKYIIE
jgi:hypothetical protein